MTDYNSSHTGAEVDAAVTASPNKLNNTVAKFIPQLSSPVHGEGKVFYDKPSHSLSVYSDIAGIALNIGQESYIRVINTSGAIIHNGSACRHNGVSSGLPSIALALADTFDNSVVLGISTHDIADGAEGFLTSYGSVGDLNTGAHPEGKLLYLSETLAGAYTTTPPQIITKIGSVAVSDVLAGRILVRIESNKVLPAVIGFLNDGAIPSTINETPQNIDDYLTHGAYLTDVNSSSGEIHVRTEGIYRVSATVNIVHDDTGHHVGSAILELYNVDGGTVALSVQFGIAKDQTSTNLSMNIPFNSAAGKTYKLRIYSTLTLTNVLDNASSFDIKSESLR